MTASHICGCHISLRQREEKINTGIHGGNTGIHIKRHAQTKLTQPAPLPTTQNPHPIVIMGGEYLLCFYYFGGSLELAKRVGLFPVSDGGHTFATLVAP